MLGVHPCPIPPMLGSTAFLGGSSGYGTVASLGTITATAQDGKVGSLGAPSTADGAYVVYGQVGQQHVMRAALIPRAHVSMLGYPAEQHHRFQAPIRLPVVDAPAGLAKPRV